jgi:hypothetical protein
MTDKEDQRLPWLDSNFMADLNFFDEQRNADYLDALSDLASEQEEAMRESDQSQWDGLVNITHQPMYTDNLSEASAAIMLAALGSLPEGEDILLDHVIAAALKELANRINGADDVKQDILDIAAELTAMTDDEDSDPTQTE